MNANKPAALLIVERTPGGIHRTMFNVGSQYFSIAHTEGHDKNEALDHCRFMADMFAKAMATIGVTVPIEERLSDPQDDEDDDEEQESRMTSEGAPPPEEEDL